MRHFFLSFLLFLLASSVAIAQKVVFSIGGSVGSVMEYTDQFTQIRESKIYGVLPDSMYEVSLAERENTISTTYKSKIQFSLFGAMDFRLSKKLELSTGLGLNLSTFDANRRTSGKILWQKVLDTIPMTTPSFSQYNGIDCDSSAFFPTGLKSGPDFRLLSLQIPVAFKYELFDGFKLKIGAQLATPIFSSKNGFKLKTDKIVENDKTICITTTHDFKDHSGNGLRDLRLSLLGGASYKINSKLEVTLLAGKSIHDVFFSNDDENFLRKGAFKPVSFQLGVAYYFQTKN